MYGRITAADKAIFTYFFINKVFSAHKTLQMWYIFHSKHAKNVIFK